MMESNGGNENLPPATLCQMGCGFYGNAAFEGMCSKCYKDAVKRKQQNPSPPPAVGGRASPPGKSVSSSTSAAAEAGAPASGAECSPVSRSLSNSPTVDTTPSVETGTPTVSTASGNSQDKASSEDKSEEGATGGAEAASASDGDTPDKNKKPKKNRCHSCKKKVGLTGFQCRCGGLFCSVHRYSDKHDCKFNYKELAQEQIRKNNPVVVSEKIQKI